MKTIKINGRAKRASLQAFLIALALIVLSAGKSEAQSLNDLMHQADTANPALKSARLRWQATQEKAKGAGVLPSPQLTVSLAGSHVETRLGPQQARINVMQMFPWFGSLSTERQKEAHLVTVAWQQYLNERNEMLFRFSKSYYDLYRVRRLIRLTEEDIALVESLEKVATQHFQEAKSPMTDVLKIRIYKDDLLGSIRSLRLEDKLYISEVNLMINRNLHTEIQLPDSLDIPSMDSTNRPAANPQLALLQAMKQASEVQTALAKKNSLPMLGVGLDYMVIGRGNGITHPDNGKDAWMPMATVTLPVFRRKYRADINAEKVTTAALDEASQGTANRLDAEWEEARYKALKVSVEMETLGAGIAHAKRMLNLYFEAYSTNTATFTELLETRELLLRYQMRLEEVLYTGLVNAARQKYLSHSFSPAPE